MSDEAISDAVLANWQLIAQAAQLKAPSPWDRETETTDGESIAFNELSDANGKMWADSLNSDMSMTCEDFDEDGVHLYDCGTLEVFEHMQTFDPATVMRLLAQLAAEHARAVAAAAEAENAKLRRLLNDAGEHIEELHGMIEDELLTGQAIELDPVLNAIKAALTDYPAALSATPAGPASTVDGL